MVCPYSNAGYDKCYVTHLTPENQEKAYYFCGGGGQHRRCEIFPGLVTKDMAILEKRLFLGSGPVLLPEPHRNHFLFFYRETYSKMQVFIPFLLDGIAKNEECLYITMDDYPSQIQITLNGRDVPPEKVEILPSDLWYLSESTFDAESSQKKYEEAVREALRKGYTGLRVIGDQGTLFQRTKEAERDAVLGFEEKMHHLFGSLAMQAICAYDLNGLPREAFHRLMASHHIFSAPLTERQLSFLCHFIPSLDVDEISYHVGELKKTKLKVIRKERVGYLFCESPGRHLFQEMDPSSPLTVNAYLESVLDELSHLLVHPSG